MAEKPPKKQWIFCFGFSGKNNSYFKDGGRPPPQKQPRFRIFIGNKVKKH
jgi:hypothetical protein